MIDMSRPPILSFAHEWVQKNGAPKVVLCMRCGGETVIGTWDVARCIGHWEDPSSGWVDESDRTIE